MPRSRLACPIFEVMEMGKWKCKITLQEVEYQPSLIQTVKSKNIYFSKEYIQLTSMKKKVNSDY
jgi:hypothetical protein